MPKSIILIISHGEKSSSKVLHNQVAQNINGDIAFFAKHERNNDDDIPYYSLSLLDNSRKSIDNKLSKDQLTIQKFLSSKSRLNKREYNLIELVERVFAATRRVNFSITGKRFFSCFNPDYIPKMYLFLDANLARSATDDLTIHFHDAIHIVSRFLRRIYSEFAEMYVYPFSQSEIACDKANGYLKGKTVDDLRLDSDLILQHAYSINRIHISEHVRYSVLNESSEQSSFCQTCCFPFFNTTKNSSSVTPLSNQDTLRAHLDNNNNDDVSSLRKVEDSTSNIDQRRVGLEMGY